MMRKRESMQRNILEGQQDKSDNTENKEQFNREKEKEFLFAKK